MQNPLLGQAQQQVQQSQQQKYSWQSKAVNYLTVVSFILSCKYHQQEIQVWSGLWWDFCAALVNLGTITFAVAGAVCNIAAIKKKSGEMLIRGIGLCFLAGLLRWGFPTYANPFWSSVPVNLTWPIQIIFKLKSGHFVEEMKPIWRPVLWGVAQFLKMILPLLLQIGGIKTFLSAFVQSAGAAPNCVLCCFVSFIIALFMCFPPLWIVPWIYTCPVAQIWLVYVKECFEHLYAWKAGGSTPSWDVLVFTCLFVSSFFLTFWDMYATSHTTMSSVLGVPLDADSFVKDLMHKGGFKAQLERSNSVLLRKLSTKISTTLDESINAGLDTKREKLKEDCLQKQAVAPSPFYTLGPIDRANLLDSSFHHLRTASIAQLLAQKFTVSFKGESGIDGGGLTRDWFDSFSKALVEGSDVPQDDLEAQGAGGSSLMAQTTDRTLLPRPSGYTEQKIYLESNEDEFAEAQAAPPNIQKRWENLAFVGRVVAVALLQKHPLPLSFGDVLMRFLCNKVISYNNVRHLDPDFYQYRVKTILEDGGLQAMNEALGEPLTFMSAATDLVREQQPLIPGGEKKKVTEENKKEYIQKLSEARLCNGRRRELTFFIEGFHSIIPVESLEAASISPQELSVLISGVQTYDVESWKANTTAPEGKPVVDWFWEALRSFDDEKRAKVLHFTTGSSRLPPGGFASLKPRFKITVSGDPQHLPVSHTCACQIDIPDYESKDILEEKLLLSLQYATGFGTA